MFPAPSLRCQPVARSFPRTREIGVLAAVFGGLIGDEAGTPFTGQRYPLIYEAAGRSYAGLPMRSNGLPFPLTRQVVDISRNPGRWQLREGWIESVGATMWFGPAFWQLSGANRQAVLECDWLSVEKYSTGAMKIQAMADVFRNADGVEGELQNKMRALLLS